MDMRRLIKKIEKPVRKKAQTTPSPEETTEVPLAQTTQSVVEPPISPTPPQYIEASLSDYIPNYYCPKDSVGNSGWQVSDVWRDLRVDDFCRG